MSFNFLICAAAALLCIINTAALPQARAASQTGSGSVKTASRVVSAKKLSDAEFEFKSLNQITVRIKAVSPSCLRFLYIENSKSNAHESGLIQNASSSSYDGATLSEDSSNYKVETPLLSCLLSKKNMTLTIKDSQGRLICSESAENPVEFNAGSFKISKQAPAGEHYFGLGDKAGSFDRRNQAYTFWNYDPPLWQESSDPMYKSVPFIMALNQGRAYGIFLSNSFYSFADFCKSKRDMYSFGAEGGPAAYYFFYGPEPKQVIEEYSRIVGRMSLPPLFALGYQQSRGSYIPESKVREIAKTIRERKIPCDMIYLDGDYKDKARPFSIDKKLFPDFKGLIGELSLNGFKTAISLDPYIARDENDPNFKFALASSYFLKDPQNKVFYGQVWPGDCAFPDFGRSQVRKWWGSLHEPFLNAGVRAIWADMNEPAVFKREDRTLPLNLIQYDETRKTSHKELHNLFALLNTQAVYEGMLSTNKNLRPFILTRSGFAGSWKYAATWTGDNSSSWNHMRISVPQLLNLGISGWTLCGSDIGGFNGFTGGPSPELLTCWMKVGAFNPIFRNHSDGVTRAREPWVDGPQHEKIRRKFIEERYRLLPYIYNTIEKSTKTGLPLMRPMFLEFPQEDTLALNCEQYMLGPSLLVAPRLWEIPGEYSVSLPQGKWFDYWSGKELEGKRTISVNPDLSQMPVYVRAGAIICKQPLVQHSSQIPAGALELDVYAGKASSESELYFDDGESLDYLHGKYCRLAVNYKNSPDGLKFVISKPEGDYLPWFKKIKLRFIGFNQVATAGINGSSLNFSASQKDLTNVLSADELNYDGKEVILELSYKNDGKASTAK